MSLRHYTLWTRQGATVLTITVYNTGKKRRGASMVAQMVKNLPIMQKTLVRFLGQEDLLEKAQATHSSILGLPQWLRR